MKTLSRILVIVAVLLLGWSLTMSAYHDESAYEASYNSIDSASPEASTQFAELRKSSLTGKHQIQDYGIVILTAGLIGLLLSAKNRWRISSPKTRKRTVLLGIACVGVTSIALFASMFLSLSRGDYPHWSDSAGIGVAQNASLTLILLFLMAPHLLFLRGDFKTDQPMGFSPSVPTWFLLLEGALVFCGFIFSLAQADILAGAFLLWSYFFFSLMSGKSHRAQAHSTNIL